jgi:DNA-directed RNA polymerase specialized sigma24 family protein
MCQNCKNKTCLDPENLRKGLLCDRVMAYIDRDTVKALRETTMELNILETENCPGDHNRHKQLLTAQEIGSALDVDTDTLTRIQAVVMRLFEIEGLSYGEIARHLSGPGKRFNKMKIKNILYQARRKIKDIAETVDT